MKYSPLLTHLASICACSDARNWIGRRSAKMAWDECTDPGWLLWWAARTELNSRQNVVLAVCACARRALKFVPAEEQRPRLAIEAAEAWAVESTKENAKRVGKAYLNVRRLTYRNRRVPKSIEEFRAQQGAAWAAACAADSVDDIFSAYCAAIWVEGAVARGEFQAKPRVRERQAMCALIRKRLVCPWNGRKLRYRLSIQY